MGERIDGDEATRYWYGKSVILGERVAELEARIAELEAAQGWRPVTEPPVEDEDNCQVVIGARWSNRHFNGRDFGHQGVFIAHNGAVLDDDLIVSWRPAPPQ